MRRILLLWLLVPVASLAVVSDQKPLTAQEVIAKHLAAVGFPKIRALSTIRVTGYGEISGLRVDFSETYWLLVKAEPLRCKSKLAGP